MARTEIRGGVQIKNYTVKKEDLVQNFLEGADWDITNGGLNATITGLKAGVNSSDAATYGQLQALEASLAGGLTYKGVFDASTGTPDLALIASKKGDFYKVSVAGTYLTLDLGVGDMIILNKNVAIGAIVAADIDVIDNTESADILRLTSIADNLTTTTAGKVLSANQGVVLKGLIDAITAASWIPVYSEELAVTNGAAVLPALINIPKAGSERVYLNGIRMQRGAGNDYTIVGSVITFAWNLETGDKVVVDYNR